MNMKYYKYILLILISLAMIGCRKERGPAQAGSASPAVPSQTIAGFKLVETKLGCKVWAMVAEEANSYNDRQVVDLVKLKIDFYTKDGDSINATLTADRGQINTASRDMEARDSVMIVNRDSIVLTTDYIRWQNATRRLSTESAVRLVRGSDWLTGDGLEASPDLKEIELKRNVRGQKDLLNPERWR